MDHPYLHTVFAWDFSGSTIDLLPQEIESHAIPSQTTPQSNFRHPHKIENGRTGHCS